jgi:multidrug efflux pump
MLDIDNTKARALSIDLATLNDTMQTVLGVGYINDFVRQGRILRVLMQAEPELRSRPEEILRLPVRNTRGEMVPLAEIAKVKWVVGLPKLDRYNGNPAFKISGNPAPGKSTGEAMKAMEEIAAQLPAGVGYDWSGTSYEERLSGSQAPFLFAVSLIAVFLALAALYESWSIPFSIILAVPLGVLGAVGSVTLLGMNNDVFFKVGLIAIIGLSSKNAILIIEFARTLNERGMDVVEATLEACRLRFRPILMTSLAFILGVMPLALSTGAGAMSRRAIGTGVVGGMITATVLAVFLVPVFFVVVRRIFPGKPQRSEADHHA